MTVAVPDVLARIVARKREELFETRAQQSVWERQAAARTSYRDFAAALRHSPPAIISEIKKASPSKGLLAAEFNPVAQAQAYAAGGAAALSVLTDRDFFQGSLADLASARAAVEVPVLRKDFTLEAAHVWEAAAHGADAILLIAALLSARELRDLRELAESLRLAALVEVHNDAELDSAIESGARILGVNNRDLHTFEVRLETSHRLAQRMPAGVIRVSESGIHSAANVAALRASGYHAFLVGEHLMKSGNPTEALRALREAP
jgi:indole-3-glycerol phosphate synthase